ncbi:antA/AntB antirepressor family protein [Plesiomonas shigelloides]|uniref:antA/AntB antirepressor family protein n=1 Tax=Plesiomonas shigelloides TaxID=703 RepID=UPI001261D8DD|nr:antA/AntB antirepressor family protein [Plesiomonas shigelloides]KAB7712828.1 antA/AntB antirepressor family protein [Plesiomonas shigelloides]
MNTSIASSYTNASNIHHTVNEFADIVTVFRGRIGEREVNVVSAKELHNALGVGKDFSTWITARIDEYDFTIGRDYSITKLTSSNLDETPSGGSSSTINLSGRPEKDYLLSVDMAKEIAMVERSEQGRTIRRYFIQCEAALYLTAQEVLARYRRKLKARIEVANLLKPMCFALECYRAEQGKKTLPHHYSNESDMIARIVLGGLTAKQWAKMHGIDGEPRDVMTIEQLEHMSYLERSNITLLDMGMDFQKRKAELQQLSQRWMARRLGDKAT